MKARPTLLLASLLPLLPINGKVLYYSTTLDKIEPAEGSARPEATPVPETVRNKAWRNRRTLGDTLFPYATGDDGAVFYLAMEQRFRMDPRNPVANMLPNFRISAESDKPNPPSGTLYLPSTDWKGMDAYPFRLASVPVNQKQAKAHYLQIKIAHYQRLQNLGAPGAAWYRHQVQETRALFNKIPNRTDFSIQLNANIGRRWGTQNLDNTYNLVSGGRAVSENLQLDANLRLVNRGNQGEKDKVRSVDIKTLQGITIAEIDWENRIEPDKPVTPQPLADAIPHDQYFLHFDTFQQLVSLIDNTIQQGTPLQRIVERRSENAQTLERYQTQLILPLDDMVRKFGPQLVKSVAITGADPYFRTGTDVTILMEATDPKALHALLQLRRKGIELTTPAQATTGKSNGVPYQSLTSPDHDIRSYLAQHGNYVMVTNSKAQLDKVLATMKEAEGAKAISGLLEYTWFRQRYEGTDKPFFLVTDAAIRRWCGPKWRIGNSRRTQAAAILAEIQASLIDTPEMAEEHLRKAPEWLGGISQTDAGPQSGIYGNLAYLTPVSELEIDKITPQEQRAYNNFRNRYQSRWRNFFDPIGGTIGIGEKEASLDITVLPLIAGSEYNELRDIAGNIHFAPDAANPSPDSLLHAIIALDMQGEEMRRMGTFASRTSPALGANALGWLGKHASVQLLDAPFWKELAQHASQGQDPEDFLENNIHRLPVLAKLDVKNPFVMTAFLGTFRAFLDQTSPGMLAWENHEYEGQTYVRVGLTDTTKKKMKGDSAWREIALYYRVEPTLLTLSLRDDLIRQSIKPSGDTPETHHWVGASTGIQVSGKALPHLQDLTGEHLLRAMQTRSWNNLHILNEWRRSQGVEDAPEYHHTYWHTRLDCPGGGEYVWNEGEGTYTSTVFGHPAKPKVPCELPTFFNQIQHLSFGLTFEQDGLRARTKWVRE